MTRAYQHSIAGIENRLQAAAEHPNEAQERRLTVYTQITLIERLEALVDELEHIGKILDARMR